MSEHKKEEIRMKARYLAQAYRIAIEEMPFKMQNDCCRDAIDQLAAVHIKAHYRTFGLWMTSPGLCVKRYVTVSHYHSLAMYINQSFFRVFNGPS